MAPRIKSLSHSGITVKDFDAAVKWYWDVFRFPLISEMEMDADSLQRLNSLYGLKDGISVRFGFLRCPKGGVIEIFCFSEFEERRQKWNAPGPHHMTLDINDAEGWYRKLKERGDTELLCTPQHTNGTSWFFFRDPDGNLIELIDLKANYFLIHGLGKLVGFLMRKTQFKKYYTEKAASRR